MADEIVVDDPRERPSEWRGPRYWMMPRAVPATAWIEVIGLTLLAVAIGWWVSPDDPLHIKSEFPWPWFAPVLIALRYGPVHGLASAVLLLASWYFVTPRSLSGELPKFHFLGGLLLVLVCAEFSGAWRLRLRRMSELNNYLEDRIERVTRRLYMLRLSHDRLEQDLLSRPTTMRHALAELRERFTGTRSAEALPHAEDLLQFLAQHCQIEAAALYEIQPGPDVQLKRVARLGPAQELAPEDPLLEFVLDRGELAHVQTEGISTQSVTPQLVVAPVPTSDGTLLGVLSVTRLPFFALNQDTLQLLSVLLGAYADAVVGGPALASVRAALPDASDEFAEELARLLRIQREFSIDSHAVVLAFGEHRYAADAHQLVVRTRRAPDVIWTPARGKHRAMFVNLLPISSPATVEGYLVRTEALLRESLSLDFAGLRIRTIAIPLSGTDPIGELAAALDADPLPAPASGARAGRGPDTA